MQNNPLYCGRLLRSVRMSVPKSHSNSKAFSAYPPTDLKVEHDANLQKFFIRLGNDCAEILYETVDGTTLDLIHTEVPSVFRGQGVAGILAKAAFNHVQANNLRMKLSCDYLKKFYKENETPELKMILVD